MFKINVVDCIKAFRLLSTSTSLPHLLRNVLLSFLREKLIIIFVDVVVVPGEANIIFPETPDGKVKLNMCE